MKLPLFPHSCASKISFLSLIFIDFVVNLEMSKTSKGFVSVYIIKNSNSILNFLEHELAYTNYAALMNKYERVFLVSEGIQ